MPSGHVWEMENGQEKSQLACVMRSLLLEIFGHACMCYITLLYMHVGILYVYDYIICMHSILLYVSV